jgi:hypothetical protein
VVEVIKEEHQTYAGRGGLDGLLALVDACWSGEGEILIGWHGAPHWGRWTREENRSKRLSMATLHQIKARELDAFTLGKRGAGRGRTLIC